MMDLFYDGWEGYMLEHLHKKYMDHTDNACPRITGNPFKHMKNESIFIHVG